MLNILLNCKKVKCEILLLEVLVQLANHIDTYQLVSVPIVTVSSQPYSLPLMPDRFAHLIFIMLST